MILAYAIAYENRKERLNQKRDDWEKEKQDIRDDRLYGEGRH